MDNLVASKRMLKDLHEFKDCQCADCLYQRALFGFLVKEMSGGSTENKGDK
jgi:hypothetical protein